MAFFVKRLKQRHLIGMYGAVREDRTLDLTLTKGVLYH